MLARLRALARRLKADLLALSLAARDPRTPWPAQLVAVVVLAYALSPIDLIPDFVPVLGLLDDLLLVPAGLWLALRLIPPPVLAEARERAADQPARLARNGWGLTLMLALYVLAVWLVWRWWAGR